MTEASQPAPSDRTTPQGHAVHDVQAGHSSHAGAPDHIVEGHRTHHFDPARVERLVSEERHQLIPAEQILRAAGVASGHVVVDLGAGPGFFTLPAARIAGENGRVYAVDVQPQLLEVCRLRATKDAVSGIETVLSEESRVPLPDAVADRVFIAFVLHEADDPTALLREAARLLRPGGEIAIVEMHKIEGTYGPPLEHRIGEDEVATLAAQLNLRVLPTSHKSESYYLTRLAPR